MTKQFLIIRYRLDKKNIFKEEELNKEVVVALFATTTQHGAIKGKTQTK